MGDSHRLRHGDKAMLIQDLAGSSSSGAFSGVYARDNPMFLSMVDRDIEEGSTTPEAQAPGDAILGPGGRRDDTRRGHGDGSRSGGGGGLPLPTPNPSTPEDDGSGGGLGDRAPLDSTSSGGVGSGAARRSSSSVTRVGDGPATTTINRPTALGHRQAAAAPGRRDRGLAGSRGGGRGHHNRPRENSQAGSTGPDRKTALRSSGTGVADSGGGSRGRARRREEGREVEDTSGGGGRRRSSRGGSRSRSASRDRNAGNNRNLGGSENGGSSSNLTGGRNTGSNSNQIGSNRNGGGASSSRLGGSRLRPSRGPGEETEADGGAFSDFSGMVVDESGRHGGRGRSSGGGDSGGKHSRGSGGSTAGGSTSRGDGLAGAGAGGSGGGSGRSLGGSGSVAPTRGQEPALKSHGCMSAATAMKLVTLIFALYNVSILWTRHYHPLDGRLCSFRNRDVCVTSAVPKALLTMARFSAGALFPSIAFCILSKCYASRYFLHHSWLALIVDFEPTHKLHTYFGVLALLCSVVHGACHIARSAYDGHPGWLFKDGMNRSGVVALLLVLVSVLPMSIEFVRDKLTYEFRKILHLLFIPFMVAICFHGRPLRILGAVLLAWYLADRLYFTTRMTFLVSAPNYKSVGRGTLVRFELPAGYQYKPGAYVQVNCPAINAGEWHPFSLFPVPGARKRAGFHVEAVGDWTDEFFRLCLENPRMPLWITAAQPSVVEQTAYYDNVLLVCTGAGITPAVSVAERFAKKKNVHLLWLSRDAGMIAMFEKQLRRVKSTVYLTGNPSHKTRRRMIDLLAPSRGDVVATTDGALGLGPSSRSSSYRSDLTALEDGSGGGGGIGGGLAAAAAAEVTIEGYRGVLRDDGGGGGDGEDERGSSGRTDHATEYGGDDDSCLGGSSMLGSAWGGASTLAGGGRGGGGGSLLGGSLLGGADSALGAPSIDGRTASSRAAGDGARKKHHRRRRSCAAQVQRARGYHPVAVNFGRPDIETIISETVEGTAIQAEWAPVGVGAATSTAAAEKPAPIAEEPTPNRASGLRQMLKRLNTMQNISKRDLMEPDLSIVGTKPAKPARSAKFHSSAVTGFEDDIPPDLGRGQAAVPPVDMSGWLILYCGANAGVERAVANTCDRLKATWRKEYFSKW